MTGHTEPHTPGDDFEGRKFRLDAAHRAPANEKAEQSPVGPCISAFNDQLRRATSPELVTFSSDDTAQNKAALDVMITCLERAYTGRTFRAGIQEIDDVSGMAFVKVWIPNLEDPKAGATYLLTDVPIAIDLNTPVNANDIVPLVRKAMAQLNEQER